ncbi:hypothetical protein FRC18_001496 [Serendipita sp. 400]|nr:hypothetical protein FRC18_001496 [Serendipita sp. 400]
MSENSLRNKRENEGSDKDGFEDTVLEERLDSLSLVDNTHKHKHEYIHERQKDIATNEQMGAIGRVPLGLWQIMLEFMSKSDQVSFSCANKHMRSLLAPIIFRKLELNTPKVESNDFYYFPLKHSILGPEELDFPMLHSVVREIIVTQHINLFILDTLNQRLYAFAGLVTLKIESGMVVSKELYGHIREHPSLKDLDMDMDSDRDVRSLPKREKYKTIASCRLRSLRAPRWVLKDLLAPHSTSRDTLVQLTIFHPNQVVALVGKSSNNRPSSNPPSIKSKRLLPLTTVEELRLDVPIEKDSTKLILTLLRCLPSLKEVDFNSDIYLELYKLLDTRHSQQTQNTSNLLLRHLQSLSSPSFLLSLLPFLRPNALDIHATDNDLSAWELISEGPRDNLLRPTSIYASHPSRDEEKAAFSHWEQASTSTPISSTPVSELLDEIDMLDFGLKDLTEDVENISPRPIAGGGCSDIHQGDYAGCKVAMKVIRIFDDARAKNIKRRFIRELDVWQSLEHPNTVPLLGYINNMNCLPSPVSPWYKNGDASRYLERVGPQIKVKSRLQLLRQVAAGLQYLHQQDPPIIHGDLKPNNILIDDEGVARLCDFGLARLSKDGEATITGTIMCTHRYAAPELYFPKYRFGKVIETTRTDIYSLACVTYQFLYLRRPYADKKDSDTPHSAYRPPAEKSRESRHPIPESLVPICWGLFDDCWLEDEANRPDIDDFCKRVDQMLITI